MDTKNRDEIVRRVSVFPQARNHYDIRLQRRLVRIVRMDFLEKVSED